MFVDQRETRLPSQVPRHGVSTERVDIKMSSRGHLGLKNDNVHDNGGRRLKTEQAMMLVNQRKTRPPSEVPRHGMLNESVNVEMSNEQVDARTSSRGLNGSTLHSPP